MLFGKKTYDKLPDERLMKMLVNGDSKAFNYLYHRYKERLLYYFYRMLHNSQEKAQDFVQDLFYRILDKPHLFDTNRRFSTWIFSIANNMCKNEYRRLEVRKGTTAEADLDGYHDGETPDNEKTKLIEKIFDALNDESEEHRSCFLLKYREGFSVDEISEILEISKGTVKSRLHTTRKKLQGKFKHLYYEH
jgi:RNA polymerase sigma-70 factor (ECF subfamily)